MSHMSIHSNSISSFTPPSSVIPSSSLSNGFYNDGVSVSYSEGRGSYAGVSIFPINTILYGQNDGRVIKNDINDEHKQGDVSILSLLPVYGHIVSLQALKASASFGFLQSTNGPGPSPRPLSWLLLAGVLSPDSSKWAKEAAGIQTSYESFVNELLNTQPWFDAEVRHRHKHYLVSEDIHVRSLVASLTTLIVRRYITLTCL